MRIKRYQVIIVGRGLSALTTALRLVEQGITDILVVGPDCGATAAIAAINFVLPDNPHGDTPKRYAEDMLRVGMGVSQEALVREIASRSRDGFAFLSRNGVRFATEADGSLKWRHLSGHSCPRSLCKTTGLIGAEMEACLMARLKAHGVSFVSGVCVRLLSDGMRVYGITLMEPARANEIRNVYASVVVAAWGGVGRLFPRSTYPGDIDGRTLAMAYQAGAALCDLAFVEYEPMVVPMGDRTGEPCPTAMLGEGAYLLNADHERFLLKVRPQGEAGAPKSLIISEIRKQQELGKASPAGGCYVDLRPIPRRVLEGYPWFLRQLKRLGLDPYAGPIEVVPMPHGFSGGIKVNQFYQSTVSGLYAVGEAAGGVHGACRCAGNAASQAVMSGLLCAEAIVAHEKLDCGSEKTFPCELRMEQSVYLAYVPRVQALAAYAFGPCRNEGILTDALAQLDTLLAQPPVRHDEPTQLIALALKLILSEALRRQESRGCHVRDDYPAADKAFERSFTWKQADETEPAAKD